MTEWMVRDYIYDPSDPLDADIIAVHKAVSPLGGVIAGGAARWMDPCGRGYLGESGPLFPGDIDVFMLRGGDAAGVHAALHDLGWRLHRRQGTTVTSKRPDHLNVQVVRGGDIGFKVWNTPQEVLEDFGFTVEMFALIQPGVLTTSQARQDVYTRTLVPQHVVDPIRLTWRVMKYARKGFTMHPNKMTDLFRAYEEASAVQKRAWVARNLFAGEDGVAYDVDPDTDFAPSKP